MARRNSRTARVSALIAGVIPAALAVMPAARAGTAAETTGAPGTPAAPRVDSHVVTWRNLSSKRYLSVKNGSKSTGARITSNPTDHDKQQHWRPELKSIRNGSDYYDMKNVNSGKCLTVGKEVPHTTEWIVDQGSCRRASTWAEFGMYNGHNHFEGWLLITDPIGFAVCEDTWRENRTIKSVYAVTAPAIVSQDHHNAQTKGCIWH
jgi:hypothetical protein